MASKRERAKALHNYAITPPKREGDRWRTNYTGKDGKRITLRARTEEELLNKLIPLYLPEEMFESKTFHKLFDEWLVYKEQVTSSHNTILRHRQHYKKYLATSKFDSMKASSISELLLETECNRIIKDFCLSYKEWVNVKTIINGMYVYACRMKYTDSNPVEHIRISVKFRQVVKKTGKTQTYNTEEVAAINNYLDKKYSETGDIAFMAVRLNFMMGLRVGELVALKWEDIEGIQIHVAREEICDQLTNTVSVAEHTKTNTDRYVYLIPEALDILHKLPHNGDYIFIREGNRLTSRQINYVLEKYAERNGLKTKSSHKLRKTYASMCNAKGVPVDFIREQLGHSSLSTTYGYIYNPLTEKESYAALTAALSSKPLSDKQDHEDSRNIISIASKQQKTTLSPKCPHLSPKFKAK
ncbi:MAG: site-specific integrase [Lachnospiraceae bacterium]|nr:site-specific integrase [Lachnospiraceae bacterium]